MYHCDICNIDLKTETCLEKHKLTKKHQAITFKEWPDLRHETHNELNKKAVIAFYLKWLLQKL